ncbi:MAG TPA: ABC transporter transmembrane domain-containing protein [Chryseosolibacter sp.]|nr:ABC transporter transmembrane domain-containing protein [Chryseosolibacter sp.]
MAKRVNGPLSPEDKRPLNKASFSKLAGVFRFMMPHITPFVFGLIALVISTVTLLAFPRLSGELLDVATGKSEYFDSIVQVAIALIVILFFQSIFSFIRVYTFSIVSEKGMADLRKAVYKKYIWSPLTFFDSRRVGELMSRVTSDVGTLQDTFSFTLAELLRQVLTLVIGTGILFYFAPTLTGFMLLTFPVLVVIALIFGKYIRGLSKKTQDKLAATNVIVEESLQSISIVKSFTNELFEISRYSKALDDVVGVAIRASKFRGLFISFIIFAIFGGIVAVGTYGAFQVQSGALSVGELFSFVLYTMIIGFSIAGLGDIYAQIQRSIGASERVLEILESEDEEVTENVPLKIYGAIEYQNVRFAYDSRPADEVLSNLSFTIQPGEKVALIGKSGAGKSTIISLLMRMYSLQHGAISVDGRNINDFNLSAYRANVGVVPQEVILFGGTILENIQYGKPAAGFDEVRDAAAKANALEFIESFPDGFNTVVGERGIKLSGGQRQRIAIARAILKDPAILILDEATSSLDAHSESLVQEALEKLMTGRTSIVIAHRLSTIKKVDRIFVIQDGQLAEVGSHLQLSGIENGIYNKLLKIQLH